jgi:hypothetical protein
MFAAGSTAFVANVPVYWFWNVVDWASDVERVSAELPHDAFVEAWEAGAAMTQDEAIAYVLATRCERERSVRV